MPDIKTSPLIVPFNEERNIFKILFELLECSNKIVPFYSLKYPLVLKKVIHLRYRKGYGVREAAELGLLSLDSPNSDLCKFVSKREMVMIQKSINPAAYRQITEDKGVFYKHCTSLGIPVPKLYAIYLHNAAGYRPTGSLLTSKQEWCAFIDTTLPAEFIIKAAIGGYGKGLVCFERIEESRFLDVSSKNVYAAKDIYDMMFTVGKDFVIQERLKNHPLLMRLSDTQSLQTLRVWTFVDRNRESHILYACFKIIVGDNVTDNHDHGKSGNLYADVVLNEGTLKSAIRTNPESFGFIEAYTHPKTGISFDGFQVPLWDGVCDLAKDLSQKFLPMRLFGWDIAVTSSGPHVLEGNAFADPEENIILNLSRFLEGESKV